MILLYICTKLAIKVENRNFLRTFNRSKIKKLQIWLKKGAVFDLWEFFDRVSMNV